MRTPEPDLTPLRAGTDSLRALLLELRPRQRTKNLLVFAGSWK